ncbi:hypothetical protein GCM10022245_04270 [Streptomyces mayteni]
MPHHSPSSSSQSADESSGVARSRTLDGAALAGAEFQEFGGAFGGVVHAADQPRRLAEPDIAFASLALAQRAVDEVTAARDANYVAIAHTLPCASRTPAPVARTLHSSQGPDASTGSTHRTCVESSVELSRSK